VPEIPPEAAPETVAHPRFGAIVIRPVRPDDAARIREGFARQEPEDMRLRFFGPMNELPSDMVEHMTRFAPGDEVTFLAEAADGELLGGVRLVSDREGGGEFAITIASRAKRAGIGRLLMGKMLRYARGRGLKRVWGDVLHENAPMLALARALGFRLTTIATAPEIVRATIEPR
jgi:acetyltransferase